MSDAALSLIILGVTVALFILNRLPVGVVAIGSALALYFTGLVSVESMTSGLGATVIVFIAALFVVSEGLESSGITAWVGQVMSRIAGTTATRVLAAVMILGALLSALITVNGAAAALVAVSVAIARHASLYPSRVLIPLAYGCSAGSLLTLSGSPVNVIIDESAEEFTGTGFGYFEFAIVGVPLVVVTVAIAVLLGEKALPHRESATFPDDFSDYVGTVTGHYDLAARIYRMHVDDESTVLGERLDATPTADGSVRIIGAQRDRGTSILSGQDRLRAGDVIVVSGPGGAVDDIARQIGTTVEDIAGNHARGGTLMDRDVGLSEIVVPPRSEWIGTRVFPGMVRGEDGLLVLAVRRRSRDIGTKVVDVAEGDTLLVHGPWRAVDALSADRQVLVVASAEQVRRQAVPLGRSAPRAAAILIAMIVLLATGVVPAVVAALLGMLAMILTRVITSEQAYRAVSWPTLVLIAALIPMSVAIADSGGAELVATPIVDLVSGHSPYVFLVVLFLLTATLGQFISNAATVLIIIPIALAAAADIGVDARPVLMLVCVAGAASLLTPIATPANMIVMNPGGYRFGDYWRLGVPIMVGWLVIAVTLIPLVWPL